MSRSVWKGIFIEKSVLKIIKTKKPKKIWSRKSIILPQFLGYNFEVYNGKKFIPLSITEDMIGHKFGEFSLTRVKCVHKIKKK